MADGGGRRRADRRRQRGGEDEAGRIGAHRVHHLCAAGDIAAEAAERLGQRALDHVDAVHGVVALADAAAARAVHADRVHFVDIGHGAVALGEIADRVHRRHVAVHGIEALEHDQLRPLRIGGLEQLFEMAEIVMPPDLLLAAGLAHALDHGIVVERVRQDQAVRQQLGDGRDAGLVGDIAGGEHQRGRLAVQVGELALQLDQRMIGAGDIAGAAGAGAHAGGDSTMAPITFGVLRHAEIVVGTPDHDLARALRRMPEGVRKTAGDAFKIGKNPVAALVPQRGQGRREKCRCNPCDFLLYPPRATPFLEGFQGVCRGKIVQIRRYCIDRYQMPFRPGFSGRTSRTAIEPEPAM